MGAKVSRIVVFSDGIMVVTLMTCHYRAIILINRARNVCRCIDTVTTKLLLRTKN